MSATKRARNTEKTRQEILEAAGELFVREGYEAVTVRKIARAANCSHGTIYIHFQDKDDLLYQASEEQFSRLLSRLRRLPRSREPLQRLADGLLEAIRFGLDHPNEFQLMMGVPSTFGGPKSQNQWGPSADQVEAFFRGLLVEAYEAGAVRGGDPDLDDMMLGAVIQGLVLTGTGDDVGRERAEALAERSVSVLLAGLSSEAGDGHG